MTYPPPNTGPTPPYPEQPTPGYGAGGNQQPPAPGGYQQPAPGYGQGGYQQPGGGVEDRNGAALTHLLGGIFTWLGALIGWLISKDKSAFNDAEGKKALNFTIWVTIAIFVTNVLSSVFSAADVPFLGLLLTLVAFAAWIFNLIIGIRNYQAVGRGNPSTYPIELPPIVK